MIERLLEKEVEKLPVPEELGAVPSYGESNSHSGNHKKRNPGRTGKKNGKGGYFRRRKNSSASTGASSTAKS